MFLEETQMASPSPRTRAFLTKLNISSPYDPPLLVPTKRRENSSSHKDLYMDVHCCLRHCQKLETSHMSLSSQAEMQIMVHLYNRRLLSSRKELTTDKHRSTDSSQEHYTEQREPDTKEYTKCGSIYTEVQRGQWKLQWRRLASGCLGAGGKLATKGQRGTKGGNGNILWLDWETSFRSFFIFQNSSSCTFKNGCLINRKQQTNKQKKEMTKPHRHGQQFGGYQRRRGIGGRLKRVNGVKYMEGD